MTHYLQIGHSWSQPWWVQLLAFAAWGASVIVLATVVVRYRQRRDQLTARQRIAAWCLAIVVVDEAVLFYLGSPNDLLVPGSSLAVLWPASLLLGQHRRTPEDVERKSW
ncbi:MAG TPA: hypothetical protein VKA19_05000 [Alphaproteobacteria bacterium]|nr:hypothetical protein [Alphaproteobacteria bacterium]